MESSVFSSVPVQVLLVLLLGVSECLSLKITRLSIPSFVPNGSDESVLMDCEYTYSMKEDKKLVVKWFHDDDPNPVYQWIPELNSKLYSEKFKLEEDYEVPAAAPYTKFRAINIQKPTTELSGTYKCEVQSLEGSDTMEDTMTVYALPTSVNLNYTIADDVVRVVCEVEGVYPLPEMSLFQIKPKTVEISPLNDTELEYVLDDGAYDLEFSTIIPEDELPRPSDGLTFFGCSIEINGTEYEKEIKVPYFPNPVAAKQAGDDSDDTNASSFLKNLKYQADQRSLEVPSLFSITNKRIYFCRRNGRSLKELM
ncbi:ig-like domain-containing protein [Caerostris darwini]|uniref:Ig-like domain-containing protein n=1 Tax=Caerostris darwini TaxID=1538125 RepID=A0AAV4RVI6_9ARAC|nr:ig-like domain-containing protein [Caerostris darwini]